MKFLNSAKNTEVKRNEESETGRLLRELAKVWAKTPCKLNGVYIFVRLFSPSFCCEKCNKHFSCSSFLQI
jgi:hypothetical protein